MRRWLILTATLCVCLPCATLLAQASPGLRTPQASTQASTQAATQPAPTTSTNPATTQPASEPAPKPQPKPVPRSEQAVKFQFAGIPYGDAVRWFAQNAGKPILGDVAIAGDLTFFDNTPYSYADALDTLNLLLAMKGFWLIETDRYFRVVPVSQVPNETKILPGLAEMETVRPGEVVTVVIPLQQVDSETASKAVVRMVSTWGSISALSKGKGVVITDSVKNIRRIQEFLQIYDSKSTADTAIESCILKRANARVVADIINKLFAGVQKRSYERNRETGRFDLVRQEAADDTVSATADERTNSIILMGRSDRIAMAKEMITKLDAGEGDESGDLRVFELKNAKAEELAKVLIQAVEGSSRSYSSYGAADSHGYRPSSSGSSSGTPVRIVPDPATNRLIVSAPADKMAAIEKLILQLDTASTAAGSARIVKLKSSDAQQLAEVVTSVLTTRGSYGRAAAGVQVAADTRTNSLILNGSAGEVQTAVKLIEDLDTENTTETREIRVIQLKAGNAALTAQWLTGMFSSEVRGSYGERTSKSTIRVEADPASNTLLISAPTAQWPKVQKLLEQLTAAAEATPVAVTRRYVLKDAKADDLGRILREIHGQSSSRSYGEYSGYSSRYGRSSQSATATATVPVTIAADRNSNTLIVSATEKDHASIAEMIKALDVPPASQGDPVRIVTLESADAARLAQTLQAMLPPTPYGQKPEISIQADPATNTLLIRAPESQRKMLEEMIASLDKQTKAHASETRTFRLKFAKASDIADVLRQMLADEASPGRGQYGYSRYSSYSSSSYASSSSSSAGSLRIVALQDGNAIVVQGSPAKLAQAEKLIATFDTPEAARDLAIVRVPLTKARAETLVETIRNMLPPAQQGREQEVYIEAEKATNSILLRAPEAQRTTLQTIITQLDNDAADLTREVRIIPVKHASAAALAIMFERLYPQAQASSYSYGSSSGYSSRRSRSSSADESVIITAAPGDKALVVEAPKTKIDSIAQLIAALDVENAPGSIEVRTYQIANSKVADLAESLRRLFASRAVESGAGRSSSSAGQIEPRFEADAATNQLMVAATTGQFEEIEKVIQKLQAATVLAIQTKAFVLKHARAEDLSAVLETMLAEAGGPSRRSYDSYSSYYRRSSSDASAVRVAAVPAANTIVVQGPPEKIALAEKLIAGFDTPEASGQATVRVVPLANADASSLAALLTKMLPPPAEGKAQQVTIQADPLTNTVLLRAPEAQRKMIEDLIARLDKDAPAQVREMRIIPVKFVSASALAEKLVQLFPSSSSAGSSSGSGYDSGYGSYSRYGRTRTVTPGGDDAKRVVITAAPGDKALIIDAPKVKIDEIVATVAKLDTEDAPSRQQVRVYQLAGSKAADVASSLAKIFAQARQQGPGGQGAAPAAPEPRFDADVATNQLMAAATVEQFVEIEKVITQVQKATGLASQTRCFPLKNARAADLAEMLQTMLGASSSSSGPDTPWWARRSSGSSAGPAVRVAAMPSANALVVQAPPEKMLLAEQLIAQFDTDKADRQVVIEIVRLANAQAPSLADAVNAALAARRPSASRYGSSGSGSSSAAQEPAVSVTAEVNSNSILVRGPAGEVKGVVDMIKRLDQQGTSSQVQVRIFKLENSSAVDIAKSVGQLFVDMTRQRASRGGSGERAVEPAPFSVAADERTNSLVVSTTPINFQIVQEILVQLDKAGTPREVGYFYLDRADPFEVAAKLDAMYADRPAAAKPVIEADYFSQLVSVVAKEADLKAIEEVIAKLDTPTAADRQPIVRVVPVSRIPASRMAELLQKMYGQMGSAEIVVADKLPVRDANSIDANSVRIFPAPPTDLDMIYTRIEMPAPSTGSGQAAPTTQPAPSTGSGQAATQPAGAEANRPKITIAVDRNSNSLVVLAPRQELESIQLLIDQLSASAADADMELRVVRVEHASPSAVADTLDALFNPRGRSSARSQIMQAISGRSSRGGRGGQPPPEPEAPPVPIAPSPITVVADMRTRSIVVRAKPSDFDMILPLVKELDRVSTVTSEVRIFTLKNTDAAEVAANLTELFTPKKQTSPSPFSRSRSGSSSSSRQQQAEMILELLQMSGEGGEAGATKVDSSSLLSISANKSTNSVIVSAPTDAMKLIQKVIEEIDKSTSFSRAVRMYPLKHAEVAPTVQALREIFADGGSSRRVSIAGRTGTPGGAGSSGMSEPIIVTGNEAGRLILVSAPDEKHELVAKVIKDLDDSQATGEITVKVYRLENTNAATVSSALVGAMQSGGAVGSAGGRTRGGSSSAGAGQLRISADPSSNSLVVRASKEDHARIAELLAELDTAQTDRYPVRTIALKHADAESVSRTLGGLFGGASAGSTTGRTPTGRTRSGPSAGAGGKGGVVIEPDAASRMILVRADDETFAKIQEVVARLDVVTAAKAAPEILPLQYARAADVAPSLQAAFRSSGGATARRGAAAESVIIVAESLTNSLIVTADAGDLERIKALVAKFDTDKAVGAVTQVLQLRSAIAADIADVLSRAAGSGAGATRSRGRAAVVPPSTQEVVVSSEPSSNTIVVTGPGKEVVRLIAMAEQLDNAAESVAKPTIKMYPVKNADIPTMVQALQQIFGASDTLARRSGSPYRRSSNGTAEPAVAIIGDEVSGRIIVSAAAERHPLIAKTITEMDETSDTEKATVQVYRVENADATTLAEALTASLTNLSSSGRSSRSSAATAKRLRISPDRGSNSLVVRGTAEDHALIAKLIAEMDVSTADKYPVQTIALNNANAADIAAVLNAVFGGQGAGASASAARRTTGSRTTGRSGGGVAIEADPSARMLLVRADQETFEKIRELAAKLDSAASGSSARTLLALKHAKAEMVAASLTQAFSAAAQQRGRSGQANPEDVVNIVPEPGTNSIIVTANAPNLERVKSLLAQLDVESAGMRTELLLLKYAKAADLAPVLAQSAAAGGQPAGRGRTSSPPAATGQGVTISPDSASNALVITGPTGQIDKIIQMAMQLDRASETSSTTVKVIQLKNGDAAAVAAMIRDMYAQQQKAAQAVRQPIAPLAVTADERANALVVSTNAEMHEKVAKWIGEIEAMKPSRGTMRLIQLKNVDPSEVERAIQQLYNTPGTRGPAGAQAPVGRAGATKPPASGSGGRVETSVLTQQRSILINASDEDFEAIQALAKALDEAAAATRQSVQVFVLTNANNTRVAAALTSMYRPSAGRAGAAPRPEDQVTVTALAMTNAVVVSAAKEKMAEVAHLIEQLDKKEVAPQLEFRIYTLENEMPTKIMPALQQLLAQIKRLRPDETIDVQADERTRSIIVTAKGTVFEQIEKLIKTLDKPPANSAADVMVIPLKRADATRLAAVLMEMIRPSAQNQVTPEARSLQDQIRLLRLRGGADRDLPELDLGKPIKITADPAAAGQQGSNSLVIVSTPDNLKALAAIVETLDAVPLAEAAKVRLIHLANADAATVAKILADVFTQGQKLAGQPKSSVAGRAVPESVSGKALVNPLNVSPDPRTNTLVLSGLEESLALAELIVKQLDVQTTVDMHDVRLLTLKNADSLTLAPILQKMLDARVQRAAALGQLDSERLRMLVAADTRSNSLIVAGSIDGFALVKSLAEQLDAAGPALGGEIQIMPLKHANAGTLSVTLVNLFNARYEAARTPDVARQKPVIIPDLRINALLVSAGADDSKVLAGLVGKLDVEVTDPAVVLEVLPLTHNDAGVIGPTIQQIFQARLTSMTPPGATPAPQDRVDVAADALANALIISASRENLAMIRELLKKVDVEPPVESGVLKIYPLVRADAQKAATMLQGLVQQGLYKPGASFAAQTNAAVAAREKIAISVDARTNSLIVSASKENLAILDQIIRGIDGEQVVPATEFRVFRLTNATATVIAPTLQQLFTQRVSRETAKDPMTVIADARSNSLIVGASPADMKLAETLIAQLDMPQGKGSTMVAFPLKKADATQVANTLKTLLAGQAGTGAAAAGAANISVDERTNTILVSAGAADLQRIKELIDQLDREQLTNVTEIRVFPLQHADATELAQILTSLLTNKPLSPVALSPNRQTLLQFIGKTEDGKELIATALQEGVLITPDRRSNAVVVAAPVKNMPLLESLVRSMDSISPRMAEIRVFTLVNADAQRMSDVLTQLFRLQGAQQSAKAVSYTLVTTQPASTVDGAATATVGNSEQDALSVTVDLRTNSLLIGGTKRYVELASKVIQDLDSSPAQERLTKVYRLRNAQAPAIQAAMQTFLDQEKQRLTSTLGTDGMGAAQRLLEREVAVVAEETSNVLLLSASPRYFSTIEALIKELDQPPPQVLIQVMLAEVTLDETNELGIDWNVTTKWNKGHDSVNTGTQFAVAAKGDGFNLSVAAGDLSFFLRALQSQGRLEVLSRPQILASDNQLAMINVGQRVPFITNSRITENGTTINTIEYQNVGIILTVTPRINPDGFVKLDVKPEISSIASSSVTISETTKAIVINQRSAETTVSVQDGHTIILGGLITTKDDHREDRVPWFGDWPLLGALFRGTTKVKERSELLIILTPHVLRTIPDADNMADEQIERVNHVRKLSREEVEDYLKKHLDDLLAQKALKDKLNGQSPTTQPAGEPASRPLRVPVWSPSAPSSDAGAPLPMMPLPAVPPQRAGEPAGVSDASWQRAQEQFLAAIAAGRMTPESTR